MTSKKFEPQVIDAAEGKNTSRVIYINIGLKAVEGCGSSQGVNYTYILKKGKWFASYEVFHHRHVSMICPAPSVVQSPQAAVGKDCRGFLGRSFYPCGVQMLQLVTKDGLLGAFLVNLTDNELDVCDTFTLDNAKSETSNITKEGGRAHFAARGKHGFGDLASMTTIKDFSKGFLSGDSFTVRLQMRVMVPENELNSVMAVPTAATFTWALRDLNELDSQFCLCSDVFSVGDYKWYLEIYPKGKAKQRFFTEMPIQLYLKDNPPVRVKMLFTVENHKSKGENVSKQREYLYTAARGKGFSDFLSAKALDVEERGFVTDGWFRVTCHVTLLDQVGKTLKSSPSFSKSSSALTSDSASKLIEATDSNREASEMNKCVICRTGSPNSGFLHEKKFEKCLCQKCAEFMDKKLAKEGQYPCPLCRKPVELVIHEVVVSPPKKA